MPFQVLAPILDHIQVGPQIYRLSLLAPQVAKHCTPGQFVHLLYTDTYGPHMRRPFSVLAADAEAGSFDIVYVARGRFTQGMARLGVGDSVSVVGPLGNGFEYTPVSCSHVVLCAGGVGAPPLAFLAAKLHRDASAPRITVINGARTASMLVALEDFRRLGVDVRVTTDDGSAGRRGTVLDALQEVGAHADKKAVVYACGPEPMLRAVGDHCVEHGIECYLSMETVMICGVGVCMGCVVKVRSSASDEGYEYLRACHEGPVFRAEDLLWE